MIVFLRLSLSMTFLVFASVVYFSSKCGFLPRSCTERASLMFLAFHSCWSCARIFVGNIGDNHVASCMHCGGNELLHCSAPDPTAPHRRTNDSCFPRREKCGSQEMLDCGVVILSSVASSFSRAVLYRESSRPCHLHCFSKLTSLSLSALDSRLSCVHRCYESIGDE